MGFNAAVHTSNQGKRQRPRDCVKLCWAVAPADWAEPAGQCYNLAVPILSLGGDPQESQVNSLTTSSGNKGLTKAQMPQFSGGEQMQNWSQSPGPKDPDPSEPRAHKVPC